MLPSVQEKNVFDDTLQRVDEKTLVELIESVPAVELKRALMGHFMSDGPDFTPKGKLQDTVDFTQWILDLANFRMKNPDIFEGECTQDIID